MILTENVIEIANISTYYLSHMTWCVSNLYFIRLINSLAGHRFWKENFSDMILWQKNGGYNRYDHIIWNLWPEPKTNVCFWNQFQHWNSCRSGYTHYEPICGCKGTSFSTSQILNIMSNNSFQMFWV